MIQSKNSIKPKTWNSIDVYQDFAEKLIKANPGVTEEVTFNRLKLLSISRIKELWPTIRSQVRLLLVEKTSVRDAAIAEALLTKTLTKEFMKTHQCSKDEVRDVKVAVFALLRKHKFSVPETKMITTGNYYGVFSKKRKIRNFNIYTIQNNKVIEVINFDRWKAVIVSFFKSAQDSIIQGDCLVMGNYIGRIMPRRVERNHNNPRINFKATGQRPKVMGEDGVLRPDYIVYYTGDDWIRIAWAKTGRLRNETAYKFTPAKGDSEADGFSDRFSKANMDNPALKYNYPFSSYVRHNKIKIGDDGTSAL